MGKLDDDSVSSNENFQSEIQLSQDEDIVWAKDEEIHPPIHEYLSLPFDSPFPTNKHKDRTNSINSNLSISPCYVTHNKASNQPLIISANNHYDTHSIHNSTTNERHFFAVENENQKLLSLLDDNNKQQHNKNQIEKENIGTTVITASSSSSLLLKRSRESQDSSSNIMDGTIPSTNKRQKNTSNYSNHLRKKMIHTASSISSHLSSTVNHPPKMTASDQQHTTTTTTQTKTNKNPITFQDLLNEFNNDLIHPSNDHKTTHSQQSNNQGPTRSKFDLDEKNKNENEKIENVEKSVTTMITTTVTRDEDTKSMKHVTNLSLLENTPKNNVMNSNNMKSSLLEYTSKNVDCNIRQPFATQNENRKESSSTLSKQQVPCPIIDSHKNQYPSDNSSRNHDDTIVNRSCNDTNTKNNTIKNNFDPYSFDDDPFQDSSFANEAFAALDSVMASQTIVLEPEPSESQSSQQQQQEPNHYNDVENISVTKSSSLSSHSNKMQTQQNLINDSFPLCNRNDEYGALPDMDFDALDQMIAAHNNNKDDNHTLATNQPYHGENTNGYSNDNVISRSTSSYSNSSNTENSNYTKMQNKDYGHITFTRYKICDIYKDVDTYIQMLSVAVWREEFDTWDIDKHTNNGMIPDESTANSANLLQYVDGCINLYDEWFHSQCNIGDAIHICSISGKFRTDVSALPLSIRSHSAMNTDDDLVMIVHPDLLVTPTSISDSIACIRRAVVNLRVGSSGFTSKYALIGQMRHELFERCLTRNMFTKEFAHENAFLIVRKHAESLVGLDMLNETEVVLEVAQVLPQILSFASKYICIDNTMMTPPLLESHGPYPSINFLAHAIHGTEEAALSIEMGLKGAIDVTVEGKISECNKFQHNRKPKNSLMAIELKTGHLQTPQHGHMAQLSLYTLMLRARYGSAETLNDIIEDTGGCANGGMLLYLNHEQFKAVHVSPTSHEIKSLINQRNVVAYGVNRANKLRGIKLEYEENTLGDVDANKRISVEPASVAELPELLHTSHSCERCFVNKECLLYEVADGRKSSSDHYGSKKSHKELINYFTGHLDSIDLQYFKEWDRLIDLEAESSYHELSKAWKMSSVQREKSSGKCISSLELDESIINDIAVAKNDVNRKPSPIIIKLHRSAIAELTSPLNELKFDVGSRVILSTDESSMLSFSSCQDLNTNLQVKRKPIWNILRGCLLRVEENTVHIEIELSDAKCITNLIRRYSPQNEDASNHVFKTLLFRLDKDEIDVVTKLLRQNLVNFMTADVAPFSKEESVMQKHNKQMQMKRDRLSWLRRCVIHLDIPKFKIDGSQSLLSQLMKTGGCEVEDLKRDYLRLNSDQKLAIEKVITAQDYTLIQGFPGTGKSSAIIFATRLLVARGKRVLITSYTHSAVDNLMLKLFEFGVGDKINAEGCNDVVRIGKKSSCHPNVHRILATKLAQDFENNLSINREEIDMPSSKSLHHIVSSAKIVGVSALTIPKCPLLIGQHFDYVIVDEAGQMSQPALLGALLNADSFVLVGDHEQLPPLVKHDFSEEAGYGISMLKRLAEAHPSAVAQLTLQYRMHADICTLSNKVVRQYQGKLRCATDIVKTSKISLPFYPKVLKKMTRNDEGCKGLGWISSVLNPNRVVVFVNTDNIGVDEDSQFKGLEESIGSKRDSGSLINIVEADLTQIIIQGLYICGLEAASIGVICPYRSQLKYLDEMKYLNNLKSSGLEMSTIDKFQGRDKDVIILSLVRSNTKSKAGRLLNDYRRLNVAFSRAKKKLVIIGSYHTLLSGSLALKPVLNEIKENGWEEILPANALNLYSTL